MKIQKRKIIRYSLITILSLTIIGILLVASLMLMVYKGHYGYLPSLAQIEKIQNSQASEIYTRDSILLGRYYHENRVNIDFQSLPPFLIQALLATEDVRFYEHSGIDVMSLFRVMFRTVLAGDKGAGGGSTLTQQLAKNLYERQRTEGVHIIGAKVREMIIARRLEKVYTKEEILQLYLNTVPFGRNTFGIKAAAKLYFNTTPAAFLPQESATLIGMLKGNALFDPIAHPERSKSRRNTVLQQMQNYGYLSADATDSLQALPLMTHFTPMDHNHGMAPYFREMLRPHLEQWCKTHRHDDGSPYNLYTDGLKIYTTLDARLQQMAESAIERQLKLVQRDFLREWKRRNPQSLINKLVSAQLRKMGYKHDIPDDLTKKHLIEVYTPDGAVKENLTLRDSIAHYLPVMHGGFMAMSPASGDILAWVGGVDARFFKYDHVLSKRQAGSVFKPFVFATALEQGMEPCDLVENDSITYEDFNHWTPENADGKFGGYYTLTGALAHSVNTTAVKLLMQTSTDSVIAMAHRLGIISELENVPSLALGTTNLSLYELVSSYATLANKGTHMAPHSLSYICNAKGERVFTFPAAERDNNVLSDALCDKLTFMLEKAVTHGTGARLSSQFGVYMPVAAKTGTTQKQADGWFVGYTSTIAFGAWVGAEQPAVHFASIAHGQGAATALPIVGDFLKQLQDDNQLRNYHKPFQYTIDTAQYNCVLYREEAPGLLEKIFGKTFIRKDQKKEKRQKVPLFKRLFKRKKNKKD